jgi:apolipoprotein N-acyltransferase
MYFRALAVWLIIISAETVHGIARTVFLAPLTGDFRARQIAVFLAIIIIFSITYLFIRWIGTTIRNELLTIGAIWVVLTLAFEVGLGFLLGMPIERILEDYNLIKGGLMPIGIIAMLFTPLVAARIRGER